MIKSNPTPYDDVNDVVTFLTQDIIEIFHDKLIGVYLFGSLTYGDFEDERSDIDVGTFIKNPVSEDEFEKLKELHTRVEIKYPKWAKRIENSYTPEHMLTSILPPGARPYYGEGILYKEAQYGNEWIINLYLLSKYGIAVVGPEFKQLVQTVHIEDVQQACVRDLFQEWEPKLRDTDWLNNPHYQSYLVLNLCRILNTILNETGLSKKKSADWVKQKYPEWGELIDTALNWHYGVNMEMKEQSLAFLKFVIEVVNNRQGKGV